MSNAAMNLNVNLDRIFLDLKNPRHKPYDTENEVIEYLCEQEKVLQLAKDIKKNGLSPLGLFAVIPDEEGPDNAKRTYFVVEGNRRVCALKLLDDPERAPSKYRKNFEETAKGWNGIRELPCVRFGDREAVGPWLSRIHEGGQDGIGQRKWNADQLARHSGKTKNREALAILDHAEKNGFITQEARERKLTTIQRYIDNHRFREVMGIDKSNPQKICRTWLKKDFDILIKEFMDDLLEGKVNSRSKKADIEAYAIEIGAIGGLSGKKIAPEPLDSLDTSSKYGKRKENPPKPKKIQYIFHESEIMTELEEIGGNKLPSIYGSITSIKITSHTPLLTVGTWAFLESLSAKAGREKGSFPAFFNNQFRPWGIAKRDYNAFNAALKNISEKGNITKHHKSGAEFNGEQLANDMETLKPLILRCIKEAKALESKK